MKAPTSGAGPAMNIARGSVLRRGQRLQRQSLASTDGGTVLVHRDDRRLVLFDAEGQRIWWHAWDAERSALVLDEDGMPRVRADDGGVALELGGPADELRVLPGEVRLCRTDGTAVWQNGEEVSEPEGPQDAEDFESWVDVLTDGIAYCATVIHHTTPDEALRRLGAEPGRITTGTWGDLMTQAEIEGADVDDTAVAAFALGPHTLLVEDRRSEVQAALRAMGAPTTRWRPPSTTTWSCCAGPPECGRRWPM
ncbi:MULTISPECIES: DUF6461 domain-containing protein [Streptomyces]|uniref:DUF6461 domain-containing protein n=1 Tax=Streptomyces TaxID=1883 RepID=UPI000CF207ED|nr:MULTISPECIES: DUF6461 domain-containing protein [Streptomyces]PPS77984.1 hypothetical protein BV882_01650 [Streptomyces sp. 46]